MGAIAEALMEYMRPLTEAMNGSHEELEKALALGQLCFNLGQMESDEVRAECLEKLHVSMGISDEEFAEFYAGVILPMLIRHEEMFPRKNSMRMRLPDFLERYASDDRFSTDEGLSADEEKTIYTAPVKRDRSLDRYAQCTCNSGKKYKFCCGASRR